MRKVYESPEAEIVSFEAMEQLALLNRAGENGTEVGDAPGVTGSVDGRGDDY